MITILWADDEIDLLKPQIMYLEKKGYNLISVTNGQDAIETCKENQVDVVFLDESMPGLSGLETLTKIKEIDNHLPVVMITKNEEENLMEEAIGSQITDYLIKPVKPQQILSTLKKITDSRVLVSEKTTSAYQQEFQKLFASLQSVNSAEEWSQLYRKLAYWELELEKSDTKEMHEVFLMQKREANKEFCKFVTRNYESWMQGDEDAPLLSQNLMMEKVFPHIKGEEPVFMVLIDNLRFDQWKTLQPLILESFRLEEESSYYSILPTATQYSRNSIFSGLTPLDIEKHFGDYWKNDDEEGGKNLHEKEMLSSLLDRTFRDEIKHSYIKITNHKNAKNLEDNILNYIHNKLTVIVYNFVDMLSHARTEMEVLKELARDEAAYRSLTYSWFHHSPLHNALKQISEKNVKVIITTDHGSIRVGSPSKCIGDRKTTSNIRYKNGKNLNFEPKDVYEVKDPHKICLPKPNVSSSYIFAKDDTYLVYPNNYNHYVNYFNDTFQHGGISLEEMIIPVITLSSK
ncbi:MAG: PglZ domain-containing protein [Chitinophagales bacterium]|nr:PglZ domain-containing protein [Chitinophagales bacterium]